MKKKRYVMDVVFAVLIICLDILSFVLQILSNRLSWSLVWNHVFILSLWISLLIFRSVKLKKQKQEEELFDSMEEDEAEDGE